jgi:hypothetical protein
MVDTDDLDEYEIYQILILKVVCAGPTNLTVGQRFKITPHGLSGSDRFNDNGDVLIGLTKFSMDVTGLEVRNVINDLEIYHLARPQNYRGDFEESHLCIQYDEDKDRFGLKVQKQSIGVYVQMVNPVMIDNNAMIVFGNTCV